MKFLLTAINAKYIHSNPAVYILRAYAGEELQEHIELAEYTINQAFSDVLADIYKRKPDVIGFSCYIWNISMVLEIIPELHKIMPGLPIWLGGPEVSFDAPKLLEKYPMVTGIMIGEGEETFRELLQYYVEKEVTSGDEEISAATQGAEGMRDNVQRKEVQKYHALQDIAGLCLPDGYTPPRELLDMSTLPFLYSSLEEFENKIIYYESSRGCPFRCSYCLSSIEEKMPLHADFESEVHVSEIILQGGGLSEREVHAPGIVPKGSGHAEREALVSGSVPQRSNVSRKRVRLRDLDTVKKELQFFLDHKVRQVKFVDRTFNCNHKHAMEIWKYIQEHDNGVTNFHFEISADILNEEEITLLNHMRPGLVQLEIGVQSTNPDTINAINRTMNVEKLEKIVSAINAGHNVHQHLDLIAGLPYEDYETFAKSFDRVYAMEPEQLQLGFLKVLKGSLMHDKAAEYGICYLDKPPYEVLYTRWLPYEDVLRLKKIEEMVELYYNSNQFRHTLRFLVREFESPFAMFEKLAEFYERKGYFTNSPARAYRYHVLLEFAIEWCDAGLTAIAMEQCDAGAEECLPGESTETQVAGMVRKDCTKGRSAEIYRELLTYDMYLRENLKSRPDFAKDLAPYKDTMRHFYEQEEQERKYLPDYTAYDHKQLAKMTHMEPFRYPVWDRDLREMVQQDKLPVFILFDYHNRDPLTFDARTVCLPHPEPDFV